MIFQPDYWLKNNFISEQESNAFLSLLIEQIAWRQDKIRMFGKTVSIPRLQTFMGDKGINYTYSNLRLNTEEWHPVVAEIRERIETLTGHSFNSVLLNYYRDGNDSMGWHRDNEPELGKNPTIACVSLGASRTFTLRDITNKNIKQQLILENGSLLWMGPQLQQQCQHSLPKRLSCKNPRISLTFRQIQSKT